ncbi:siderophore-interacting protein [Rhodococcus sp. IEGM 1354]|uniref:siderophore-interacting protein n=1 Tax=Rhodococcus sp. IEGM 1354 TaxID=3047088 RepID=UPI0024B6A633|nr:siderophore-interacting protein [Rhodococcus sp. IEGM 1354]MDI9933647.1 siderophore-interacting protein [Rhodococcus sp. IEGM 1354]
MTALTVTSNVRLSPSFRRVTMGGEGLADLDYVGFDQAVRLFFPRDGQIQLRMPTVSNDAWLGQFLLQPKSRRPWVRNYTIRRFRPGDSEIDIDFVRHGDADHGTVPGPASAWAEHAQPGDPVGIFDEGYTYLPPSDAQWHLLAGEESAVPAILSILECVPEDVQAEVFLEVPLASDIPEQVYAPQSSKIHWIVRDDPSEVPGTKLLREMKDAPLADGKFYTWVAGEHKLPTGLRRHLVNDRGTPKSDITFGGYWRHGKSSPG